MAPKWLVGALARRGTESLLVWLSAASACLLYAFIEGQDINWDQKNYHIYSVFALFNDRASIDILPSQLQTWVCPFGSILQYLFIMHAPVRVATAVFAILASTSVVIVYFIAEATLGGKDEANAVLRIPICCAAALGAFTSPIFRSELGTTFNDYVGNIFILLAVFILLRRRFSLQSYFLSGALLGLAADVKLTNIIFALGWGVAVALLERRKMIRPLLLSGMGSLAAYLPIGAIWNFYVYQIFKNPVFPNYNNLFKSNAYFDISMLDERFKPKSLIDALDYFPKWLLGEHPTAEIYYRDGRFIIALFIVILAIPQIINLASARADDGRAQVFDRKASGFLLIFSTACFIVWLSSFGIERYVIALEQLTPLAIFILLSLLCGTRRNFIQAAMMSLVILLVTTVAPNWGRASFSHSWFDVRIPDALKVEDTLYVMLSGEPIAYVIPFFPASDIFIRIEGNMPLVPTVGLGQEALSKIRSHKGPIRTLSPGGFSLAASLERLKNFELEPGQDMCVEINSKADKLQSCPLVWIGK